MTGFTRRGSARWRRRSTSLGEVYVVAPDREQSAVGHALTLHRPLRVDQVGERRFAVNGTPSDCVNLARARPLAGAARARGRRASTTARTSGDDVTYSGTVSAAMEGTLLGVPSMAVSQAERRGGGLRGGGPRWRSWWPRASSSKGCPAKTLLNVNVPRGEVSGIRMTRLGHRVYREKVIQEVDPRGRPYYWIGAGPPEWAEDEASDIAAVHAGLRLGDAAAPGPHALRRAGPHGGVGGRPQRAVEEAPAVIGRQDAEAGSQRFARERERMVEEQVVGARGHRPAGARGDAARAAPPVRGRGAAGPGLRGPPAADRGRADDLAALHRRPDDRAARP